MPKFFYGEPDMAITKEEKQQAVQQLSNDLGRIKIAVMTDYRGLSVKQIEDLRAKLREAGISYRVTKNTLLKIAMQQNEQLKSLDMSAFTGPMAMAFGF